MGYKYTASTVKTLLVGILLFNTHVSYTQESRSSIKRILITGCALFFAGYACATLSKNITGFTKNDQDSLDNFLELCSRTNHHLMFCAFTVYLICNSGVLVARANKTFLERKKIKKPDMSLTIPFVTLAGDAHHAALLASIKQRESILHKARVRAHEIALINDIKQSGSAENIQMLWDLQEKKSLANKMIKEFFQHLAENSSEIIPSVDDIFALLSKAFYMITKKDLLSLATTFIQEKNKLISLIQQHKDVHDVNNEHAAIAALINLYDQVPLLNLEQAIHATVRSPFCYGNALDTKFIFDRYKKCWRHVLWSNKKASFFYGTVALLLFQSKNIKQDDPLAQLINDIFNTDKINFEKENKKSIEEFYYESYEQNTKPNTLINITKKGNFLSSFCSKHISFCKKYHYQSYLFYAHKFIDSTPVNNTVQLPFNKQVIKLATCIYVEKVLHWIELRFNSNRFIPCFYKIDAFLYNHLFEDYSGTSLWLGDCIFGSDDAPEHSACSTRLTGAQRKKILALIRNMHNLEGEMRRCLPPPITMIIYDYCEKFI